MTHILPPHTDLNLAPSSLHTALHMDHTQQQQAQQGPPQQQQQPQQGPQQAPPTASKKRRKADGSENSVSSPSEPRRLRRSHEACARCRSKKIKCDSKHPKCTACATAGVPCQQEDRHRQTLTLRGHTEFVERQIALCDALLKRHLPGYSLANIEDICSREGIEIDGGPPSTPDFQNGQSFPQHHSGAPPPASSYYPPLVPPGYPHPGVPIYGPYPHIPMGPPGTYSPHMHPGFPPPPPQHLPAPHHQMPPHSAPLPPLVAEVKGQDPQSLDMSDTRSIAKSFGVNPQIVSESQFPSANDREDLAVGSSGLTSGRDQRISESSIPNDPSKWISTSVTTNALGSPYQPGSKAIVWLPKDRKIVNKIVDVYFTRLNIHRPIFFRSEFDNRLNALYDDKDIQHDPGFVCSMYLILALGTLSELNHKASMMDGGPKAPSDSPILTKKLLSADWPEYYEFFERALAVKPHLRVTVTSLQALILLQWYLYTERQGRSLWRLVGSLVRLAIELGLHHDPTSQSNTFTEEEAQLRIRLWGIVMLHDRGTSILLGRPLAISPSDSNTPHPSRSIKGQPNDFTEHFLLSHPIAEIQADIINSLYAPSNKSADTVIRHATRIVKSMVEFRRRLPDSYRFYFSGTDDWAVEKRQKLVQDITEDQGLTLLKFGITRILLLRALFSSKELDYGHRSRALVDAIITSHNIIVVHNHLIRFPDIAFFVSPIPLHIAAMVILYGHMSQSGCLSRQVMIEDVWMALDMLPRFRWRWERKDLNGGHPLISKLAEKVLDVNLCSVAPAKDPMLIPELDWETDSPGLLSSPSLMSQSQIHLQSQKPAVVAHSQYPTSSHMGGLVYGPQRPMPPNTTPVKNMTSQASNGNASPDKLAEVPAGLFYPFYPESSMVNSSGAQVSGVSSESGSACGEGSNGDYSQLLAAAAAQPIGANGSYGCQPSQDAYMLEEIAPAHMPHNGGHAGTVWVSVNQRSTPPYIAGS